MQSQSVAKFKPYKINRCYADDLDPHVKGAAFWDEFDRSLGYYVFDPLSRSPRAIEYNKDSCQWVFIVLDTRTRNWIATDTVPQAFRLGRQSIRHSTVQAAEVDQEEVFEASDQDKQEEPSNVPSSMTTGNIYSLAMSTTAALTLAGTATTGTQSQFMGFSRKGKGPMFPPYVPGGGGPSGSGSGGPPGGGGSPPGRGGSPPGRGGSPPGRGGSPPGRGGPPGGGGFFPAIGPGAAAGGGGRLGGNPPRIFDGTCSEADAFMNKFNLYPLTNIGVDQVDNPMKRAALLLGFIQGENVKDWVKRWTVWALDQYNTGLVSTDEHYWNTVTRAFKTSFQDTGATEHAKEKLHHLSFTPGEIDGFITKFESLANEAGYLLNNRSTTTLFASKLPNKMMDHLYKVVRPCDFAGWADGARQYHQDNQAVQNIRDIHGDTTRKAPQKKFAGFSAEDLAKILKVKMPSPHPDAMDTWADRNRSVNQNH